VTNFVEIYMKCPLEVLISRDVKGLYKKALAGEIPQFTGISDPYEPPPAPEVTIDSSVISPEQSVEIIQSALCELGILRIERASAAQSARLPPQPLAGFSIHGASEEEKW
jgi:adenylylsulfate kinase-like enzyme